MTKVNYMPNTTVQKIEGKIKDLMDCGVKLDVKNIDVVVSMITRNLVDSNQIPDGALLNVIEKGDNVVELIFMVPTDDDNGEPTNAMVFRNLIINLN